MFGNKTHAWTKLVVPSMGSMIQVGASVRTHGSPAATDSSPMNLMTHDDAASASSLQMNVLTNLM